MNYGIVRVKICCIGSVEEAELAVEYGASAIGLVSEMPSGPGVISEELISEIAAAVPPGVSSFLLTSKQSTAEIIEQQRRTGVNTIQIVDKLENGNYEDFKKAIPGVSIVQVINVNGEASLTEAVRVSGKVNGLLLDSGNTVMKIKQLGGTGRTHDWDISAKIVKDVRIPVYLAGGLNAENVNGAIKKVRPFGIDLCSGIRTNGKLDEEKLGRLFRKINFG